MTSAAKRRRKEAGDEVAHALRQARLRARYEVSRGIVRGVRTQCVVDTLKEQGLLPQPTEAAAAAKKAPLRALFLFAGVGGEALEVLATALADATAPAATPTESAAAKEPETEKEGGEEDEKEGDAAAAAAAAAEPSKDVASPLYTIDCVEKEQAHIVKGQILAAAHAQQKRSVTFVQAEVGGALPEAVREGSYDLVVVVDAVHKVRKGGAESGDASAESVMAFAHKALAVGGVFAGIGWAKGAFKGLFAHAHSVLSKKGLKADPARLEAAYPYTPTAKQLRQDLQARGFEGATAESFKGGYIVPAPVAPWLSAVYAPCVAEFSEDAEWMEAFVEALKDNLEQEGMLTEDNDWMLDMKTVVWTAKKAA